MSQPPGARYTSQRWHHRYNEQHSINAGNASRRAARSNAQRPPSETFDWGKAIRLFTTTLADVYGTDSRAHSVAVGDVPPKANRRTAHRAETCRKGLHAMTPENTAINRNTGHRRCRTCIQISRKGRRR